MQLAVASGAQGPERRFRLPPAVPPFNTRMYRIFSVIWLAVFLLALIGPAVGLYYRYTSPENNSQLMLGSRAGFAVSPSDASILSAGPLSALPPTMPLTATIGTPRARASSSAGLSTRSPSDFIALTDAAAKLSSAPNIHRAPVRK